MDHLAAIAGWKRASLCLGCCLLLCFGCSKSNKEPKITGKKSDPPVSLQCVWKPGYRYHLRLEMAVLTDSGVPDPKETGLHRVTFAQECLITATNTAKGGNVGLDMEILSLAMERAKGTQVPLSFDSEQGGESSDDLGYVPVLKGLIGGHLHFAISPDGRMLKADGIPEWLARAIGDAPTKRTATRMAIDKSAMTNAGPSLSDPAMTNAPANMIVKATRALAAAMSAPPAPAQRGTVATTVRNFFTPDLFRQMLEFNFLPTDPVRVGEEWKKQGDTPVSGHGRFKYDAVAKFEGWQRQGETNCARIKVAGTLEAQKQDSLKGTLWINQQLGFPVTTILDTQTTSGTAAVRKQGTNNIVTTNSVSVSKTVRQNVTITLLETTPIEAAAAEAAASAQ